MNISQPMNKEFSLEEISQLKKSNTTFKKTLSQLKEKLTELKELKNELTSIYDELIHFDIIDILSESIINESNLENLISITKSVKNCKEYFSKSNINLEYLEKTRNLEKILKIKSFNKLISLMNQGDGFVNDLKVKELIDLNEDVKNIFKKHFFIKRQKEFYKKIVMAKNKQSVCYLIQHELIVKNVLFDEENDFYLYDVLSVYFDKLSKEEIINFFQEESDEESEKVFVKYLRMFYEERFKEESVIDL